MKWFRERIKTGARLALFALAVQMVLSFGHFHPIEVQAAGLRADVTTSVGMPDDAVATSVPQRPHSHHGSDPADFCAICSVMALAGTALFSTPPVLELPQAIAFLYEATEAEFSHLDSARVAFQPRAPPLS